MNLFYHPSEFSSPKKYHSSINSTYPVAESVKYCHSHIPEGKSFYFDHVHIVWDEQISLHQSAEWELSFVIKGSGTRVVGEQKEEFTSGEIVFLPPHVPHCWYFNKEDHDEEGKIENITIIFPMQLLTDMAANFPETRSIISKIIGYKQALSFVGKTLATLQQALKEMLPMNDMMRLAMLMNVFSVIAESEEMDVVGCRVKQDPAFSKIHEISRFVVHNYQRKISLDEVAKYIGMSRSSFCSFYKKEKGKSFFTSLNEYRIECSCLMLKETKLTVAEICFAVGFDDVPHYNRTFKKQKGQTPKDYRGRYLG